jgi:RNA polymerase sigma-70 factor (ECF subfamily)
MSQDHGGRRLSDISTAWTLLRQVHGETADEAKAALELLLVRYRGAVYRYLRRAVGGEAAEDLTQEFGLALLRGRFRHADPQKGRFRDYVRTALFNLVRKHRRAARKRPPAAAPPEEPAAPADPEQLFDAAWRDELLARTWAALRQAQPASHELLHFRAKNPDLASADMARALGGQFGRPLSAEGVRQGLHRAREKFADLLLAEVSHSLEEPTAEALEEECAALGLLEYCKPALARRR